MAVGAAPGVGPGRTHGSVPARNPDGAAASEAAFTPRRFIVWRCAVSR